MNTYEKTKRQHTRLQRILSVIIFCGTPIGAALISAYFYGLQDLGQDWALHCGIGCLMVVAAFAIARPIIRKSNEEYLESKIAEHPDGIWCDYGG
jgi:hypothetical protein